MHAIGLDIGGSKTHAMSSIGDGAAQGARTAHAFAGSANLASVGPVEAATQLDAVLADLARQGHGGPPDVVCAGSAGVDTPEGEERLRALIAARLPGARVLVVHDTHLILAAAGVQAGIAVISGTGSVAWGRTADGRVARAGGWGYLLGDEGSGYVVARGAVQHALRLADEGTAPDPLTRRLLADCGLSHIGQLLDHFYAMPERRYWAERSEVVFALADACDVTAAGLVAGAALELATLVRQVHASLRCPVGLPVVLGGGVLVHQSLLQDGVRAALTVDGLTDLRVLHRDPAEGALLLALTHHDPSSATLSISAEGEPS